MKSSKNYPKIFKEFAHSLTQDLTGQGVPKDQASFFAFRAVETIRKIFGGQQIYIPKGLKFFLSERDAKILSKFNGRNYAELSRELGMTERNLRRIVSDAQSLKQVDKM